MGVLAYSGCKYSIFLVCTKYFTGIFQRINHFEMIDTISLVVKII